MKRKVLFILAGLMLVGIVTGAIVSYVSNTGTASLGVETPMSVWFNETGTDTYDLGMLYGGEKVNMTVIAENLANEAIDVYKATYVVTAPGNFDGTEFDSINMVDRGTDMGDILPYICFVRADGTSDNFANIGAEAVSVAKLMLCSDGSNVDAMYSHPSGSVIDNVLTIDLNAGLQPGSYQVEVCHLVDLTGTC